MENWKKLVKEIRFPVMIVIGLIITIFVINYTIASNYNLKIDEYNPFDYIRRTEEQHILEGNIVHVEYIDWETCKIVMNDGRTYSFHGSDYGKLKASEGNSVRIICFTNGWDGKYRTYSCNDGEVFEIREHGIFPLN